MPPSAVCATTSRRARSSARAGEVEAKPKARPQVRLTHPDRIYWPDAGVTKQGLADYYAEVWPRMAPLIVNRPVALLRCPGGTEGQCFFQKHAWKGHGKEILTFHDPEDDSDEPLVAVDGLPALIALVQGGALEIHTWQSSLDDLEHPDQIVMDLDPGEGVPWPAVIKAAEEVRDRLGGGRARRLRQDVGRQGTARGGAAEADAGRRVGRGQGLRGRHGALDGGRRPRPLRRDDHQVEADAERS